MFLDQVASENDRPYDEEEWQQILHVWLTVPVVEDEVARTAVR